MEHNPIFGPGPSYIQRNSTSTKETLPQAKCHELLIQLTSLTISSLISDHISNQVSVRYLAGILTRQSHISEL